MTKETIVDHSDIEFIANCDMTKMSTMRLRAVGDLYIVKSEEALALLLGALDNYTMIGWGANLLLQEKSEIPYVKLEFNFDRQYLEEFREEYHLPASCSVPVLSSAASRLGLKGWEVFTGVPASLGGALVMNAGTGLGEIGEVVKSFRYMKKNGEIKEVKVDDQTFSYRKNNVIENGDVILSAVLVHKGQDNKVSEIIKNYLKYRNASQPMNAKTCGCIFKNYQGSGITCRAGQYIDILGLKGLRYKGLRISPLHANFIENIGEATYTDVMEFIEIIKEELKLNFNVDFEIEVKME